MQGIISIPSDQVSSIYQYNSVNKIITIEFRPLYDTISKEFQLVSVNELNIFGSLPELMSTDKSEIYVKKGKKLKNWNKTKFWQKGR